MKKPDYVYFLDRDGIHHSEGMIVFGWTTAEDTYPDETVALTLDEVEPVLRFIKNHFHPNSWYINNGKVTQVKNWRV
jgi:hypothetical protein